MFKIKKKQANKTARTLTCLHCWCTKAFHNNQEGMEYKKKMFIHLELNSKKEQ